jgi:HEAT repeat protein
MHRHSSSLPVRSSIIILLGLCAAPLGAEESSRRDEEAKLIATLRSEASLFEKAKACQRLAVAGTRDAVPALAALLDDDKLAHYARFALEPLPDPAADEALREAAGRLQGKHLIGVLSSIGQRRDAKALGKLEPLLAAPDLELAAAAAAATGHIGTPEAAALLEKALRGGAPALREVVAAGALTCAEQLLAAGRSKEAVALYDALAAAELPSHLRAAAARGAIVARGSGGLRLLLEGLESGERDVFDVALGVARELQGSDVTQALLSRLEKLPPERRALLIAALGDRGDEAALPAVLEAARKGPQPVRVAALRALGGIGGPSAVPVLLEAAAGEDAAAAGAALAALEALQGEEVDAAIAAMLEGSDGRLRAAGIELAGRRGIRKAVPALRKAAEDGDEALRVLAIEALGRTAALGDLPFLVARLAKPRSSAEETAARDAIALAAKRLPDKDASAAKVLEALESAPAEAGPRLIAALGLVGGRKALEAVAARSRDPSAKLRDAAFAALADWGSEDAAPVLLGLVERAGQAEERLRAFRAFSRVVSRLRFPKEERLGLCRKAEEVARSDDERKVVIETLAALPAIETFPLLSPYYTSPALKDAAAAAAVTIGERILRYQADAVRDAMKEVLAAAPGKEVAERARKLYERAGGKP